MKKLLVLIAAMTMLIGVAIPASAAPAPPPQPNGWTTTDWTMTFGGTNPCTGEQHTRTVDWLGHTKNHTDGTTTRSYLKLTTSDGWSTNGWVHASTNTDILPGGGHIETVVYVVPVFEDDGPRVMFLRHSTTLVVLADGTVVVNNESAFEASCADSRN